MTIVLPQRGFLQSQSIQQAVRGLQAAITGGGGVLLSGEPGTGRRLFARAIHRASHENYEGSVERLLREEMQQRQPARPFVIVDCAGGSEVEQRLFGFEPAAGAADALTLERVAAGSALHQAVGGTLVLGHLPEMARRIQARLVRVLRDGEAWVHREGQSPEQVSVRIRLMATMEVGDGAAESFIHPELLKRLAANTIQLPPLRHRREDIPGLVRYLLADICNQLDIPVKSASSQATELLSALQWRGNVEELRGLLRALAAKVPGRLIRLTDVLAQVRLDGRANTSIYGGTLREARARFEREYVAHILEQHHGRMAEAAKALGIQRTNLYRKVRQLSVNRRRPGRPS